MNNSYLAVVALAVIAALVLAFVPPVKVSGDAVLKAADNTTEAGFFRSLYPSAVPTTEERGCVAGFIERYVKDISMPLMARDKEDACSDKDKDWVVSYSATGIVDTNGLYVGVDDDNGVKIIDAAFISPYDDVYVLNYSFGTVPAVIEKVLNKSGVVFREGWASYYIGETKYLTYSIPHDTYTTVLVYVEKTPEYKAATMGNLRSEMTAAHAKFEEGGRKFTEFMKGGFIGEFNVTASYLYYPKPAVE